MSDIVQFETGQPVEVALQFPEPKIIESQYDPDGRAMYALTDGRVMFHDRLTAAKIKALGVQPGECFFIEKRKKGRLNEWHVFRESGDRPDEPTYQRGGRSMKPHERAARLPEIVEARNAARNLEAQLEKSLEAVAERKPPQTAQEAPESAATLPAWGTSLGNQTFVLIDVFARALEYAGRHGNHIRPDDVRALMTTAFINLSKRPEGSRAA